METDRSLNVSPGQCQLVGHRSAEAEPYGGDAADVHLRARGQGFQSVDGTGADLSGLGAQRLQQGHDLFDFADDLLLAVQVAGHSRIAQFCGDPFGTFFGVIAETERLGKDQHRWPLFAVLFVVSEMTDHLQAVGVVTNTLGFHVILSFSKCTGGAAGSPNALSRLVMTRSGSRVSFRVEVVETPLAQKFSCRLELSWNYSANSIPEPPNSFGKSLSFIKPSRM